MATQHEANVYELVTQLEDHPDTAVDIFMDSAKGPVKLELFDVRYDSLDNKIVMEVQPA